MAGLSRSLWVLQPLVAGRFFCLGGMRVAHAISPLDRGGSRRDITSSLGHRPAKGDAPTAR